MVSQFSGDFKYFAQLTSDGKLGIWNTARNKLEQEFTPDFHLNSPCICLQFVEPQKVTNKGGSPQKKKRFATTLPNYIALGTRSGKLLLYSITNACVDFNIDSDTNKAIKCLSWHDGVVVYSATDHNVLCWNLEEKRIKSKWKTGNDEIFSILVIPNSNQLLTASRSIKVWNRDTKQLLRTFTGHANEVCSLRFIQPANSDPYVISASKGDRILSSWNLNGNSTNAIANFLLEGIVSDISVICGTDEVTRVAATTSSGVCHVFHHVLNGKGTKPIKPVTTIQVVSDTTENKEAVSLIPIISATFTSDSSLSLSHGTPQLLTFEEIKISTKEKTQCLVRKNPKLKKSIPEKNMSKLEQPITDNNVVYLDSNNLNKVKRKHQNDEDVSMEKQLEKMQVTKTGTRVPKNNAHLLIQGLHSNDRKMLQTVFCQKDETLIRNTIERLPVEALVKLIPHLTMLIQAKTDECSRGILWLKNMLQVHAGVIVSDPKLLEMLNPISISIESKLELNLPLHRLKGKLDLVSAQIENNKKAAENKDVDEEAQLVFNDYAKNNAEIDDELEMVETADSDDEYTENESDSNDEEMEEDDDVIELENGDYDSNVEEMET